jgi:hypothetical protein
MHITFSVRNRRDLPPKRHAALHFRRHVRSVMLTHSLALFAQAVVELSMSNAARHSSLYPLLDFFKVWILFSPLLVRLSVLVLCAAYVCVCYSLRIVTHTQRT